MDHQIQRRRRFGRKFAFAVFAAALAVAAIMLFTVHITEPQAGLLLTVVAAPCLAIIAGVVGVEGIRDITVAKNGEGKP